MPRKKSSKKSTGKKKNIIKVRTGLGRLLDIDLKDLHGERKSKRKKLKKSITRVIPGSKVYGKPRYK